MYITKFLSSNDTIENYNWRRLPDVHYEILSSNDTIEKYNWRSRRMYITKF